MLITFAVAGAAGTTSLTLNDTLVIREVASDSAEPLTTTWEDGTVTVIIPPVIYQPDLLLRTSTELSYLGDNVYNDTGVGQTKAQSINTGQTAAYYCRVQNDGNTADSFTVTGTASAGVCAVGYVNNATGAIITGAVTGAGWNTGILATGQYVVVLLRCEPTRTAPPGTQKEISLQAVSTHTATCVDVVKATTTVVTTIQPDLLLRTSAETNYLGDNVYNATGVGQTKAQNVAIGQTAAYYCRVQNDGNTADSFTITGPAGVGGWAIGYVDNATGAIITGAVTGAGWNTGVIAPGQYVVVLLRVVPSAANSGGMTKEVWLQAQSQMDALQVDVVKTITGVIAIYKPDLLLRTGAESSYLGNNVYNDTGVGQTKAQNAAVGQTASYYCRIQNDGNTAESFTITGPAGSSGWAIGYVNYASGGIITGNVTGSGWNTGVIAPRTICGGIAARGAVRHCAGRREHRSPLTGLLRAGAVTRGCGESGDDAAVVG